MTSFTPSGVGGLSVAFESNEVAVLRDLAGQLSVVLEGGVPEHGAEDPIRSRLFPRAYIDPTEDRAEATFQSMVHDDLVREKSEALAVLVGGLEAVADQAGRVELTLDRAGVEQWVGALNDLRLALGTALGVTDDDPDDPDDDPRSGGLAVYHWLTSLQGEMIEGLLGEWAEPS